MGRTLRARPAAIRAGMPTDQKSRRRSARAEAKRELIVGCAMRHFAEHGYQGARIEDMAAELEIAKGSIFQHYGSKAGLFLECYKRAVSMLPAWLPPPPHRQGDGFFLGRRDCLR